MNATVRNQVLSAVQACEDKKGEDLSILEMDPHSSAFTDYFILCTGKNPRQIQAIADEVELRLKREGTMANQVEGYNQADWVLLDYVDFVVHVFSEASRKFYDLERLWKSARKVTVDDLKKKPAKEPRSDRPVAARAKPRAASARTLARSASRTKSGTSSRTKRTRSDS